MNKYRLNEKNRIYIYGASYRGRNLYEKLMKMNIDVHAFIDNYSKEKFYVESVPIISSSQLNIDPENDVFFIMTRNPVSVANNLYNIGAKKIIFSSVDHLFNVNSSIVEIGNNYTKLIKKCLDDIEFPCYDPHNSDGMFYEENSIRKIDESNLIVYISADIIYVCKDEECNSASQIYFEYCNLIKIMGWLLGKDTQVEDNEVKKCLKNIELEPLIDFDVKLTNWEKLDYLQSQLNEFSTAFYDLTKFPLYGNFVKNKFILDKESVLYACFLIAKGYKLLPLIINDNAYAEFLNKDYLCKTIEYCRKHDLLTSYTLIEHPYFYKFPVARDIGENSRLFLIAGFLNKSKINVVNKKILDVGSYYGGIARYFAREGAEVTSVEYNENSAKFQEHLNRLLHCENIRLICGGAENVDSKDGFDVVIMLTVLYWHYKSELGKTLLKNINGLCNRIMIWESGDEIEEEKKFIRKNSDFKYYIKIANTVGTGKVRELGVWWKSDKDIEHFTLFHK